MKNVTKLSLLVAATATMAGTAAFADDQPLQSRLAADRAQSGENQRTATVAVYADRRGVSQRSEMRDDRTEGRFELRPNGHGGSYSVWVAAK